MYVIQCLREVCASNGMLAEVRSCNTRMKVGAYAIEAAKADADAVAAGEEG